MENILYETNVKYNRSKFDTLLVITKDEIQFKRKKGLINKKYKIVDLIKINDIKIYRGNPKIKSKKNIIKIETSNKNYKFTCNSLIESKKIVEQLFFIMTGKNLIERASRKTIKITERITKTAGTVALATGTVATGVTLIYKNRKEIAKNITNFSKTVVKLVKSIK